MKKVIRNVAIGLAVLIAVVVLMPISFVKTSDRGATHDYFPEDKDKNFVKDHDFVEYHHQDGKTSFFDPSIYDVSFGLHGD